MVVLAPYEDAESGRVRQMWSYHASISYSTTRVQSHRLGRGEHYGGDMDTPSGFDWYDLVVRFEDLESGSKDMFYLGRVQAENKEHAKELLFTNLMRDHAMVNFAPPLGPVGESDPRLKIRVFWFGVTRITDSDLLAYYDQKYGDHDADPPPSSPPPAPKPRTRKKPSGKAPVVSLPPRGKKP